MSRQAYVYISRIVDEVQKRFFCSHSTTAQVAVAPHVSTDAQDLHAQVEHGCNYFHALVPRQLIFKVFLNSHLSEQRPSASSSLSYISIYVRHKLEFVRHKLEFARHKLWIVRHEV